MPRSSRVPRFLHSPIRATLLLVVVGSCSEPGPDLSVVTCTVEARYPFDATGVLVVGDTVRWSVSVVAADGTPVGSADVSWSATGYQDGGVTERDVVTVDQSGLVSARLPGSARVRVEAAVDEGGSVCQWTESLRVIPRPASLVVVPESTYAIPGNTMRVGFVMHDTSGKEFWGARYDAVETATQWTTATPAITMLSETAWTRSDCGMADQWHDPTPMWLGCVDVLAEGTGLVVASFRDLADTAVIEAAGADIRAVTSGGGHACARDADGLAYCWGSAGRGARGEGSTRPGWIGGEPLVPAAMPLRFQSLEAGAGHTCGLTLEGAVYCWGDNSLGQVAVDTSLYLRSGPFGPREIQPGWTFSTLAVGAGHACAVSNDDRVLCWGSNAGGEVSPLASKLCEFPGSKVSAPYSVPCWPRPMEPVVGLAFATLAAGSAISCGLTASGALYCWGAGYGPAATRVDTTRVWTEVALGGWYYVTTGAAVPLACGLAASGTAFCWGKHPQLDTGDSTGTWTPVPVATDLTFTALTVGGAFACGLTAAGDAYCWWGDESGLGGAAPERIDAPLTFERLSAGVSFVCADASDGDVYCWGSDIWKGRAAEGKWSAIPQRVGGQR